MALSSLDIRSQSFSRRMRGVDPDEVRAYLSVLAESLDDLQRELRYRDTRIADLESKLVHYERIEDALQEALRTARESQRAALDVASQQADHIRAEAHLQARALVQDAEGDRNRLRQETQAIAARRKEISARLRAFLMSELEMLAHFEGEDPIGFIQLRREGDALSGPSAAPVTQASVSAPAASSPPVSGRATFATEEPVREPVAGSPAASDSEPETLAPDEPRSSEPSDSFVHSQFDAEASESDEAPAAAAPAETDAEAESPSWFTPMEASDFDAASEAPAPGAPVEGFDAVMPGESVPAPPPVPHPEAPAFEDDGLAFDASWDDDALGQGSGEPASLPPAFAPEPHEARIPSLPGAPAPAPHPEPLPTPPPPPIVPVTPDPVTPEPLASAPWSPAPAVPPTGSSRPRYVVTSLLDSGADDDTGASFAGMPTRPSGLPPVSTPDEVEELARVRRLLDGLGG